MTITGIPASARDLVPLRPDTRGTSANDGTVPAHTRASTAAPLAARADVRARNGELPLTAPAGTDPELWSILTSEERAFFSRTSTAGPLTYSKVMRAKSPAPVATHAARGGRVDIRV